VALVTCDKYIKAAERYFEAVGESRDAEDRRRRADADYAQARKRIDTLTDELANCVGLNRPVMVFLVKGKYVVVSRRCVDGHDALPEINIADQP
jgi:hypothetical protein